MSTREHDEREEVEAARRDAVARLDAEIAAARPVPDFAAMLARARELAPDVVPAEAVERAASLAPVIPLGRGDRQADRDDAAALAPFTAALRAELEAKIAERRMASIPPPPLPARRRRLGPAIGLAFAAAAALVLLLVRPARLDPGAGGATAVEANADGASARQGEARRVDGAPEGQVPKVRRPRAPAPTDSPAVDAIDAEVPVPSTSSAEAPAPAGSPAAAPTVPADSRAAAPDEPAPTVPADSSAARTAGPRPRRPAAARPEARPAAAGGPSLEDEAQALWERGELAAAERKYREIVDLAGRSARAELAYGDLFALARQLRGADGQADAWREYLARFPAGRFADDARAGLCARAAEGARATCWRDYLERHPTGAHRTQAEAALAAEGSP